MYYSFHMQENFFALNLEIVGKKHIDGVALLQIDALVVSEKNWNTKRNDKNKSKMYVSYVLLLLMACPGTWCWAMKIQACSFIH